MQNLVVDEKTLCRLRDSSLKVNVINSYFQEFGSLTVKMFNVVVNKYPKHLNKIYPYPILVDIIHFEEGRVLNSQYCDLSIRETEHFLNRNRVDYQFLQGEYLLLAQIRKSKVNYNLVDSRYNPFDMSFEDVNFNNVLDSSRIVPRYVSVELYVANLIKVCRESGWVYDKEYVDNNSCTLAWDRSVLGFSEGMETYLELAKEYIDIFLNISTNTLLEDSLTTKILILLNCEYIEKSEINSICWMYPKVCKFLEISEQVYYGEVGESFECRVTLMEYRSGNSKFGTYHIYKFKMNGSVLVYLGSTFFELTLGKDYFISGKIKSHSTWSCTKQTNIIRLKVKDVEYD